MAKDAWNNVKGIVEYFMNIDKQICYESEESSSPRYTHVALEITECDHIA
jgi:hypothetical protein